MVVNAAFIDFLLDNSALGKDEITNILNIEGIDHVSAKNELAKWIQDKKKDFLLEQDEKKCRCVNKQKIIK